MPGYAAASARVIASRHGFDTTQDAARHRDGGDFEVGGIHLAQALDDELGAVGQFPTGEIEDFGGDGITFRGTGRNEVGEA